MVIGYLDPWASFRDLSAKGGFERSGLWDSKVDLNPKPLNP